MKKYCMYCDNDVKYEIVKEKFEMEIKGVNVSYEGNVPRCSDCGEEIYIAEYEDKLTNEANKQYRLATGLITTDEILEILKKYNIGKKPLASLLEWGDKTIIRYVEGKMPIRAFSDQLLKLKDPKEMEILLNDNRDKLSIVAAKKVEVSINELKTASYDFKIDTVFNIVYYFLNKIDNQNGVTITHLKLQKLLYYAQAWSLSIKGKRLFNEKICAWAHGPVIKEVYDEYKQFAYNQLEKSTIDESNYSIDEMDILDLVWTVYGKYDAKYLEALMHAEHPWNDARKGYSSGEICQIEITLENIEAYYKKIRTKFDIKDKVGLNKYVTSIEPKWN